MQHHHRVALPPPGRDAVRARQALPNVKDQRGVLNAIPKGDSALMLGGARDLVQGGGGGGGAGFGNKHLGPLSRAPVLQAIRGRPHAADAAGAGVGGAKASGWDWGGGHARPSVQGGQGEGAVPRRVLREVGSRPRVWSAAAGDRSKVMKLQPDQLKELVEGVDEGGKPAGGGGGRRRALGPIDANRGRALKSAPTYVPGKMGTGRADGMDGLLPGGVYIPRGALGGREMGILGLGAYDELERAVEGKRKNDAKRGEKGRRRVGLGACPAPGRDAPVVAEQQMKLPKQQGGVELYDDLEGLPADIAAARLRRKMHDKIHTGFQKVTGGVFLGPAPVSHRKEVLLEAGITHILNATDTEPCLFPEHFKYMTIPVGDTSADHLEPHLPAAFSFLSRAVSQGGSVYVHCVAGVSRSASIVIYFMMRQHSLSLLQAFRHVKDVRACIQPNDNFWGQLVAQEERLRGEVSCSLHQYQVRMLCEAIPHVSKEDVEHALAAAGGDSGEAAKALASL